MIGWLAGQFAIVCDRLWIVGWADWSVLVGSLVGYSWFVDCSVGRVGWLVCGFVG